RVRRTLSPSGSRGWSTHALYFICNTTPSDIVLQERMAHDAKKPAPSKIAFDTHPDRYVHWKLAFEGPVARLSMDVQQEKGQGDYILKLNSYDLGVDIELADAINRIR